MAKTRSSVTLAYNKAVKEAGNLENIARKVETQKSKLFECRGSISKSWRGENSVAYLKKMEERERELAKVISDLKSIAGTIKKVATTTYNADMKAINLAQKRKYGAGNGK